MTDTWTPLDSSVGPTARTEHTMIWTGSEVIIFGGRSAYDSYPGGYLNTGARYDPKTGAWEGLATEQAPSPRSLHMAVWTGKEMIVWGGNTNSASTSIIDRVTVSPFLRHVMFVSRKDTSRPRTVTAPRPGTRTAGRDAHRPQA